MLAFHPSVEGWTTVQSRRKSQPAFWWTRRTFSYDLDFSWWPEENHPENKNNWRAHRHRLQEESRENVGIYSSIENQSLSVDPFKERPPPVFCRKWFYSSTPFLLSMWLLSHWSIFQSACDTNGLHTKRRTTYPRRKERERKRERKKTSSCRWVREKLRVGRQLSRCYTGDRCAIAQLNGYCLCV